MNANRCSQLCETLMISLWFELEMSPVGTVLQYGVEGSLLNRLARGPGSRKLRLQDSFSDARNPISRSSHPGSCRAAGR